MPRPVTVLLVAVALAALGCGTGSPPSPAGTAAPPSIVAPTAPAPTAPPAPTSPPMSPGADDDSLPPDAFLVPAGDAGGAPWDGALGAWTWTGAGSDSPWFVPPAGPAVAPGATLTVGFRPDGLTPSSWSARWATVDGSLAGTVVASSQGAGGPAVDAPADAGPWALQVEADFGPGQRAAWYWRVVVAP